jgi:hypothetical protein
MVSVIHLEIRERGHSEFKSKYFQKKSMMFISSSYSSHLRLTKVAWLGKPPPPPPPDAVFMIS